MLTRLKMYPDWRAPGGSIPEQIRTRVYWQSETQVPGSTHSTLLVYLCRNIEHVVWDRIRWHILDRIQYPILGVSKEMWGF